MSGYYAEIVANIGLFAILAMSLNVICGLTGLLHLGQAGFYAAGAYAAGMVALHLWIPQLGVLNFATSVLAGMLVAALLALVIGAPCLRLRGDYLAIATLGFGEIVRLCVENIEALGGATGLSLRNEHRFVHWWLVWIFVLVTWVLLVNLKHSALGRALLAIREDEIAARAMGVNVPAYKTFSLVLCAVFAGLAGALFAHKVAYIAPKRFDLMLSIDALLMVVLGGLGSFTGSVLAAAIIIVAREALGDVPYLGPHRELFLALLLVLLIRFVPHGLLGMRESPAWARGWWRRRPEGADG